MGFAAYFPFPSREQLGSFWRIVFLNFLNTTGTLYCLNSHSPTQLPVIVATDHGLRAHGQGSNRGEETDYQPTFTDGR